MGEAVTADAIAKVLHVLEPRGVLFPLALFLFNTLFYVYG